MTTKSTYCKHEDVAFNRAEPDVGIMSAYWECNDCGETTSDYEMADDYDVDEDGHVYGGEWKAPVWPAQDCEHEDYTTTYDRSGNPTFLCEDCGAETDDYEADLRDDGRGTYETPLWND